MLIFLYYFIKIKLLQKNAAHAERKYQVWIFMSFICLKNIDLIKSLVMSLHSRILQLQYWPSFNTKFFKYIWENIINGRV